MQASILQHACFSRRAFIDLAACLTVATAATSLIPSVPAQAQSPRSAERKVALVVGNSAYRALSPLANPQNDAAEVATTLRSLGYEVTVVANTGLAELTRELAAFRTRLNGATVGLFYYSGHGFQTVRTDTGQTVNHIVPVDFGFDPKADKFATATLDSVVEVLRSQTRVGLVFMDACRDDPRIAAAAKQSVAANRSVRLGTGLSSVPVSAAPSHQSPARQAVSGEGPAGILIAYSTDPGNVASDGPGQKLSPFTRALTTHIRAPGLSMAEIMARVSSDVATQTRGTQTPWSTSSLTATAYQFTDKPPAPAAKRAPAPPLSGISIGAGGIQF